MARGLLNYFLFVSVVLFVVIFLFRLTLFSLRKNVQNWKSLFLQ